MNEFFKKLLTRAAGLWAGWSMRQRGILLVVAAVVIAGVIALFRVSASPVLISVIDHPIRDENALDRIVRRLNEEDVRVTVSATGMVQVQDETTARRMRNILIRENLIPDGVDPWEIFDKERWTITDMERNINKQRAQKKMITEHIKAIDDIDDAIVEITWPKKELFAADQNPTTASVTIFPKPGSDIAENRKKIEGIQKLLIFAVEGLKDEYITINDRNGMRLNDFEGREASDRLALIERENKLIMKIEKEYRDLVLKAIQKTFSVKRVQDLNIKIDMDMSKKTIAEIEPRPIMMKPPTPGLPYDDSVRLESITIAESTSETKWEGTGYNPEGPGGTEGQTPPAFKDMSNLYGRMTQKTVTHNEEIAKREIQEEKSPQIDRLTVAVNIDGTWEWKYDEKRNPVISPSGSIERIYTPIPDKDLRDTEEWIKNAVGYNSARGDSVTVRNIKFDRTEEFKAEDDAYFKKKQMQVTIIVILSGLTLMLFGFIVFRMISREMERRRRLAEEARARREQMLRESAMAEAEQEGMEVSISLEERTRMELMESVINMAKEHPEDAAQLIRTWLLEE